MTGSDTVGIFAKAGNKDFLSTVGREPAVVALALAGTFNLAANAALLTRVPAGRALALTKMLWAVGVQSGNYDIGLYDLAGNALYRKGSTAVPAAGVVTETFTAVSIPKGVDFYQAIAFDNTTATMRGITLATGWSDMTKLLPGTPTTLTVGTSFPLPATITPGSTAVLRIPAVTFREA